MNGAESQASNVQTPAGPVRWGPVLAMLASMMLIVALAAGTGLILSHRQTPVYAARAELNYSLDGDRSAGFLREDRRLTTQLVMISGRTVLGPVAEEAGLNWEDLADDVSAEVVGESEVIRIEVQSADPQAAKILTEAIITQYLSVSRIDDYDETRQVLEADLATAQRQLADLEAALAGSKLDKTGQPTVDALRLLAEHDVAFATVNDLETKLAELDLDELNAQPATVLTEPYLLDEPVAPRPLVAAAAGGLLGLLAAMTATVTVARLIRHRRS